MDDMNLFDRFHAAFDVAPPAGGFDRLRRELSRPSADRQGRPAFHQRWNRMTIRLTAAFAAVILAISLVAAYLAGQHALIGYAPAGSGPSVAAYQSVVEADHAAWTNATADCQSLQAQACLPQLASDRALLVRWRADLDTTRTPNRFAVVGAQMKRHLDDLIQMFDTAISAAATGNQTLYDKVALYATLDSTWLDHAAQGISRSHLGTASQYSALVQAELGNFAGTCSNFCQQDAALGDCAAIDDPLCAHDLITNASALGLIQADFVETVAPDEFRSQNTALQLDLAQADNALMAMNNALLKADAAALRTARGAYMDALVAVEADLQS